MLLEIATQAIARCGGEARAFEAAAAWPRLRRPPHLLGVGKAAAQMVRGFAAGLAGEIATGLVVTAPEYFDGFPPAGVEVIFAGHPQPDARSERAARKTWSWLGRLEAEDQLVVLLSGGASSLLSWPVQGLSVAELASTTEALLGSGLAIDAVNTVRKHLGRTGGGQLARHCRAQISVLILSDVLGDDPSVVGSGPFAPDESTFAEALDALSEVAVPRNVRAHLEAGARGLHSETPAGRAPCFEKVDQRVLANVSHLMAAAAEAGDKAGFARVHCLALVDGDVHATARQYGALARSLRPSTLIVGAGEPTVTLPAAPGKGGRNQQLALLVASEIAGLPIRFLALGSDGIDGASDVAGAWVDGGSLDALGGAAQVAAAVARADAYPLLARADRLIRIGPTGTNVLDLHLMMAEARP